MLEGQCELRLVQLQQDLKDQQKVVAVVQKEYDVQIQLLKEEKEMIKAKTSKFQKGLSELQRELDYYKEVVQEKDDKVQQLTQQLQKLKYEHEELARSQNQWQLKENEGYE